MLVSHPDVCRKILATKYGELRPPKEKVATNQLHSDMDEDHTCLIVEHTARAPVAFA